MYKFKEMDKDVLWKNLLYHDKNDNVMCCSVPEVKNADLQKEVGLIEGHAYSLLDVREYRGERLVHVRNPWGKTEWTGAWSDGDSAHWTPLARRALQYEDADDGSFWMPYSDWLRYFEVAVVNIVEEGWGVATEGVKLEARTSLVPFKLSEPCDVYLTARLPCDNFGIRACVVSKDVPHIPYGGTSDAYTGSAVVSADQRLRLPAGEFYVVIEAFPQHAQTMLPIDINVSLYCSDSSVSFLPRTPAEKTAASTCGFLIPSFEQKYGCCEACGCALGPAHMNIRGQHYHSTCLLCYYCGGQLGNSVFFKGDKLACKACAAKPRPPPYAGDELKRRVAERKSGGQKAYKEKCQRIFSGISGIFKLRIRFRKPRRDQLRAMFDSVDEDGDGEIPASELGPLIKALGCPEAKDPVVRDIQLRSIMARTDLNESGTVNFKELTRIMETDYLTTLNAVILKVDRAAEIFHSMEVGGTGVVPQAQPLYNAVSGEKLVGKSYKKFVKCVGESRVPFNTFIKFCIQFNSA